MGRMIIDREQYLQMKDRVLDVLGARTKSDPYWFLGIRLPTDDSQDIDFILQLDVGEFPVVLCTSTPELRRLIDDWHYKGVLFLLMRPEYPADEIREKCIFYFNRERRVRRSQMGIPERKPARR